MNINIDRRSKVETTVQIEIEIRNQIFSGRLNFNTNLPEIDELAQTLSCSPDEVKHAYKMLVTQGLIQFDQSHYVVQKYVVPTFLFDRLISLNDIIKEKGYLPAIETLYVKVIETPKDIVDIIDDKHVINLKRIYKGDGMNLFYLNTYIPMRFEKLISQLENNLPYYDLFIEHFPVKIKFSNRSYEAVNANPKLAELLQVPNNSPLSYSFVTTYDEDNNWLEINESYGLPDVMHFVCKN